MLVNDVKDPRVGFVTVTEVRLSDHLRNARVYVSVYGSPKQRAQTLEALGDAAQFFRRQLSGRLKLRYVPELNFSIDETLDEADRLNTVFRAIADGASEPPEGKAEPVPVTTVRSDLAQQRAKYFKR